MRILDPKMFRKALEKQAQNKIFEYTLELKKKKSIYFVFYDEL